MNTPNNARSILSKSKIKQAFVGLLETHNLSDITIGSICEKAGINRTTFYSHFASLTDLFKALETELCEQLEKLFMHDPNVEETGNIIDIIKSILDVIKKYKNLHKMHVGKMFEGNVVEKMIDKIKAKYMPVLFDNKEMSDDLKEHFFVFLKSGIIGVIRDWVKSDCPSSCEQVAKSIVFIVNQIRGKASNQAC